MRGEFIGVWSETAREIWLPLIEQPLGQSEEGFDEDIFCDLYRELTKALKSQPSIEALAEIIDDPVQSREAFEKTGADDFADERALVGFFESVHGALEEFEEPGDDKLTNRYFNLLTAFIEKFSLRYELRRPCILCPTLPGVFASLVHELRVLSSADPHLDALMKDFENAVRDLRHDCSDGRIKTCIFYIAVRDLGNDCSYGRIKRSIPKQITLVLATGRTYPGVTGTTLGAICDQVGTWPHEKLKAAMKDLYGFASDYPGIRHGGTSANALRAVDMRDLVAMSILLIGFTPYFEHRLSAVAIFGGSTAMRAGIPMERVVPVVAGGSVNGGRWAWLRRVFRRSRG
jgi:hypothetical protein